VAIGGNGERSSSWRVDARALYGASSVAGRQVEILEGSLAGYIGTRIENRRWALRLEVLLRISWGLGKLGVGCKIPKMTETGLSNSGSTEKG
jgi:hypothetical protein